MAVKVPLTNPWIHPWMTLLLFAKSVKSTGPVVNLPNDYQTANTGPFVDIGPNTSLMESVSGNLNKHVNIRGLLKVIF